MDRTEKFRLLEGVVKPRQSWADFGSGDGAFTLVLRELGGPATEIYSVERDNNRLDHQRLLFEKKFPDSKIRFLAADFSQALELPPLDGLLLANSLHFWPDQERLLRTFRKYLKPGGRLILIEYETATGNRFVPYPIPFLRFRSLAEPAGFLRPTKLTEVPSRYWNRIYSAEAVNPR